MQKLSKQGDARLLGLRRELGWDGVHISVVFFSFQQFSSDVVVAVSSEKRNVRDLHQ